MANRKKRSKSQDVYYKGAKATNRSVVNRKNRLEKHILNHPNDEQAEKALDTGLQYRRKSPKSRTKVWTPERQWLAKLYKMMGLNGNLALHDPKNNNTKNE